MNANGGGIRGKRETAMQEKRNRFLRLLGQIPARLTAEQTAWVLNCQPYDIPVLVAARLLKPLDNPQPNSVKYFASVEVLEFAKDHSWLARMTNALNLHWNRKNAAKKRDSNLLSGINLQ
jgi:hypothetical protein